jgi:hypothetical protein
MMDGKSAHPPPGGHPAPHGPAHPGSPRPPATTLPPSHREEEHERPPKRRGGLDLARLSPWLQGVGGALALLAAFVAGGVWNRPAEEERRVEAEVLIAGLRYDLAALKASFDRIADAQTSVLSDPERLLGAVFIVPPDLAAARVRFHVLGREGGIALQRTLADAERVEALLDFIRKDARAYADYYAKRGFADNSGAGTAFYFNARDFDAAMQSLSANLATALRLLPPERGKN